MAGGNIYREVNSLEDLRRINRKIRTEMGGVDGRDELTELKKRSDYLCTLTRAPAWRTKFRGKTTRMLEVAREEERKTVDRANSVARRHGWDADYSAWGTGS